MGIFEYIATPEFLIFFIFIYFSFFIYLAMNSDSPIVDKNGKSLLYTREQVRGIKLREGLDTLLKA